MMRVAQRWSAGAALGAALLAGGCSYLPAFLGGDDYKPGPLPDIKGTAAPRVAWQLPLGAKGRAGFIPTVMDGKLYAAAPDGTLLAVDLANGKQEWRVTAAKSLSCFHTLAPLLLSSACTLPLSSVI